MPVVPTVVYTVAVPADTKVNCAAEMSDWYSILPGKVCRKFRTWLLGLVKIDPR